MVRVTKESERVLLFGSKGQLGSRIRDSLELNGLSVIQPIYVSEVVAPLSIRVLDVEATLAQGNFSKIIHAASPNAKFASKEKELALDWAGRRSSELTHLLALLPKAHLVHLSSVQVYGESQSGLIEESSPLLGISPYAEMHKILEAGISLGQNSTILRLGNVFGCAGRDGLISWDLVTHDLARQLADSHKAKVRSNPNQARDFVPAALVVEVVERVIYKHASGVFNLTTGQSTTLRNWVNVIRDRAEIVFGSPCEIMFEGDDQPRTEFRFDNQKLAEFGPFSSSFEKLLVGELDALLEFAKSKAVSAND